MRPYLILGIVGVLVAALAVLAVRSIAPTPATQPEVAQVATTRILVAADTIPAGSFVRPEQHLKWEEWPQERVSNAPYLTEADTSAEDFANAVARRTIFAGEPIAGGALVRAGEGGFMSAVLAPGKRAVSISVNSTTGNAGFIFPGDKVDLILTHSVTGMGTESFVSETFVEDIRVLAVDQMLDNPENKALLAKTVTVEVNPQQAEAINVATEMGKISLSLRSLAADTQTADAAMPVAPILPTPDNAATVNEDYFYPAEGGIMPSDNSPRFTRDSDISTVLGGRGGEAPTTRVRVIRGDESVDMEFRTMGVAR